MKKALTALSAVTVAAGLLLGSTPVLALGDGGGFSLMTGPGSTGCCKQ